MQPNVDRNLGLCFNPLTSGEHVDNGAEGESLVLRAFAKSRSCVELTIVERREPALFAELARWLSGGTEPAGLDDVQQKRLWAHGVLVSPHELGAVPDRTTPGLDRGLVHAVSLHPRIEALAQRGIAIERARSLQPSSFVPQGFVELPPLLAANDCRALADYYVGLASAGWLAVERDEIKRHIIRNDAIGRMLLTAFVPLVADVVGHPVVPTYSFASYYFAGSGLVRHVDRPGRIYTLGLFLAYEPDSALTDGISPWPFVVHPEEGEVTLLPRLRGGVLFRGRELAHSRPLLPEGHRCLNLLLHYAPA
jgi:hypothetical protein